MKYSALVATLLVASASAFAPVSSNNDGRASSSSLAAKKKGAEPAKKTLSQRIFDMDLFDPQNNMYGARNKKKKTSTGKITSNSYVPSGLTAAQYKKLREGEKAKKEQRYNEKMAKAGIFEDFTAWYKQRGTDTDDKWVKSVTRGHTMVKTKYDWSGSQDKPLWAKVAKK